MTPQNLMLLPLSTPKLSIGCLILDDCLGGGIPCNSRTELVGESGSRKTQLCLQLTLRGQLPPLHGGLGASSVYIFTEFSFQQLGNLYHASYPNIIRLEPLEDIYGCGVHDAQQLIHVLGDLEAFIGIDHTCLPVKLIVIDSIAALFRSQYQTTPADFKRQSEMFFNISGKLKGLANKFGLAVVVTKLQTFKMNSIYIVHAFQTHRTFHLVFAPHVAYASAEFVITKEGIVGVSR
ncbi:PREDICTED: DNA repair protein XRCC3 homolog [Prunus mume]|uniref:DNA repair protein XRCC3 homolog n=1 Tax=Prunus mume TaxID=102107 RepID=A0ABM0NBV6_PRUMU|nr:PREDICTED: DNA repair protein XRCC3 homolog [Prunus mume]